MKKHTACAVFVLLMVLPANISNAQPSASGVRDIENRNILAGQSSTISLTINNTITQALSLQEKIPFGWTLTRIYDDANSFRANTNEWVWFNMGAGIMKTIRYQINVPADAAPGIYYIVGNLSNSSGIITSITGTDSIVVLADSTVPAGTTRSAGTGASFTPTPSIMASGLQGIAVGISPSKPSVGDNISINVELTYPTAGYTVEFKEASIKDNTISINMNTKPPVGLAAQVITTYTHIFLLGNLSEGSYICEVNVDGALVDKGNFEVSSIKSPFTTPASAEEKKLVKTPGFTWSMGMVLISYTILKLITYPRP